MSNRCVRRGILGALVQLPVPTTRLAYARDEYEVRTMEWMGSCDGTSEYPNVCNATDGYVRCDDAGEVVRSKLFLGHFEWHTVLQSKSFYCMVSYCKNPKMHWIFGGTITVQGGALKKNA